MPTPQDLRQQFENTGRLWLRGAVCGDDLHHVAALLDTSNKPGARISTSDIRFQKMLGAPWLDKIAAIWPGSRPVRAVGFDKSDALNWRVPWHQDRVIAVNDRVDLAGYGNWTNKAGIWHCEPPLNILKQMLFVRVHLDKCDAGNGAMEIARESHKAGLVAASQAHTVATGFECEVCSAEPGDILILKMLTLHRSGSSNSTAPRRTIRLDFSYCDLPAPLGWTYILWPQSLARETRPKAVLG